MLSTQTQSGATQERSSGRWTTAERIIQASTLSGSCEKHLTSPTFQDAFTVVVTAGIKP
jgi:hypothetical protein